MGAVQLPNLCGPRSVMLSFEDSWGGKFGRGDNIKVVIGSQWIWTILRPLQWSSQLGEEASTTANGLDQLFQILKENHRFRQQDLKTFNTISCSSNYEPKMPKSNRWELLLWVLSFVRPNSPLRPSPNFIYWLFRAI